jgi:hypothetical protein
MSHYQCAKLNNLVCEIRVNLDRYIEYSYPSPKHILVHVCLHVSAFIIVVLSIHRHVRTQGASSFSTMAWRLRR